MRVDRERPIHLAVLHYLRLKFPGCVIHHSPNELALKGREVAMQIAKAKHFGMAVGFPDLVAFTSHGALFFEVKAEGNYLTPEQKAVGEKLTAAGFRHAVVRSVDDVDEALEAWGVA